MCLHWFYLRCRPPVPNDHYIQYPDTASLLAYSIHELSKYFITTHTPLIHLRHFACVRSIVPGRIIATRSFFHPHTSKRDPTKQTLVTRPVLQTGNRRFPSIIINQICSQQYRIPDHLLAHPYPLLTHASSLLPIVGITDTFRHRPFDPFNITPSHACILLSLRLNNDDSFTNI